MSNKMKEFFEKHKKSVLVIGGTLLAIGTTAVIINKVSTNGNDSNSEEYKPYDDAEERAYLESIGAVYKDGYDVAFASKEVAEKFLEEKGQTYQLDILDDETSVVWISK